MPHRVIGLMSGTSYDAIDAAAADLWFEPASAAAPGLTIGMRPLGLISAPLPPVLSQLIRSALPPQSTDLQTVCRLDTEIGQAFAALARQANHELCQGRADLIASHGQTLFHWVEHGRVMGTLQLGQPAWIAAATGVSVVSDFRPNDVAYGGQGAPLVSEFDRLLLAGRHALGHRPAALNLGGIANVTVLSEDTHGNSARAWDTGPANALIDAEAFRASQGRSSFDRDGALAASGTVDDQLLDALLADPYYRHPPPKSTGKELFTPDYLDQHDRARTLSAADRAATVTELTVRTVAASLADHASTTDEIWVSGGGLHNPLLMAKLTHQLAPTPVRSIADLGIDPAAKEALAFALLGFLSLHQIPGTTASATGASQPSVLGRITVVPPLQWPSPVTEPLHQLIIDLS